MKAIYVSGPYSGSDIPHNVQAAIVVASAIRDMGHAPLVPHFSMFEDMHKTRPWDHWIESDLVWVRKCDAIYRIPGASAGAEIEVAEAVRLGIPVFRDLEALREWGAK